MIHFRLAVIDPELLQMLRCPETRQSIRLAEPALIERINQAIIAGQLRNRAGRLVTEKIEGGLVRSDGRYVYAIRCDIPVMLIDEAIPLV